MAGKSDRINIARAIRYLADPFEDKEMAQIAAEETVSDFLFRCQQIETLKKAEHKKDENGVAIVKVPGALGFLTHGLVC